MRLLPIRLIAAAALAIPLVALDAGTAKLSASARRGLAFAEQRCAACHAIGANRSSPNPESPSFEAIANMPGLTDATLREFLRDSHNYPAAMNFTVERARVRDLSAYILTLRRPGYRPDI